LLVPDFVLLFRVFCCIHVLLLFAAVVVFLLGLLLEAVGALLCLLLLLAFCVFFSWFVSKWFYDTFTGAATGAARYGSFVGGAQIARGIGSLGIRWT
jgi:hypothetical protein